MGKYMGGLAAVVTLLVALPNQTALAVDSISAEEILAATGVRGGLVVHLGCGDGRLTAALADGDGYLVHGLDTDAARVDQTRRSLHAKGLYGRVSVDCFEGRALPYADNLVNLIVAEDLGEVAMAEVIRVLCPGGTAYVGSGGEWTKTVKPRPAEIDEWTHYLHSADNNPVAEDSVVGPPRHFQWIAKPRFSRSHDHLASVSAVVSSGGRVFYIVDEGSIAFVAASPRWRLVARDAFNGVRLWEREIADWEYHLRDFRSGPADIARRLVAVGDRVYVTLGYGQPVTALDAVTGETVRTYEGTEGTREILHCDDTLFLVLGEPKDDWRAERAKEIVSQEDYVPPFEKYTPPAHRMRIMAVNGPSGELLWEDSQPHARELMPSTLAVSAGRVYFQNTEAVICLDATSGKLKWQAPRAIQRERLAWSTPTLVVHDGVVFSADRKAEKTDGELFWLPSGGYHQYIRGEGIKGQLIALDGETGERLWSCPAFEGFNAPVDVMIAGGLLWTGSLTWGKDPGITEARDPKTGEVIRRRPPDGEFLPRIGHSRCHRCKATSEYIILGRSGVEFVDLATGGMVANRWIRGMCHYGVMPANGLLYVPPHSCVCSTDDLLKCGFTVLAPGSKEDAETRPAPAAVLEEGPAFASSDPFPAAADDAWPTYRHDGGRSGATRAAVSHDLRVGWKTELGGKLTSPVIAQGVLLVAETDAHRVHALDAATGERLWTRAAGARIDSPPTIHQGRALFGSADGRVYCVRLDDGELIWRYRAAGRDRHIVADGQLESAWPVSGSVLAIDDAVYFAAGRTSYLDGGMFLCKLEAATGRELKVQKLVAEEKTRNGGIASGGHLPDVLSTDGDSIFMRIARFDLELARRKDTVAHLWCPVGFLDDSWWHRTYWQIGVSMASGWGGWPKAGNQGPAGRLLVTDGSRVFGFGRNQYDIPGAHLGIDGGGVWGPIGKGLGRWTHYRLFGATLDAQAGKQARREAAKPAASESGWTRRIGVLGRAMVLADETLFVAGPLDAVKEIPHEPTEVDPLAEALETGRRGRLLAVSAPDGKTLADHQLASPPVYDGMAVAQGRLYLSTKNGEVVCMTGPAP